MNEIKWKEALHLSRLIELSEDFHAKARPILSYVARLEGQEFTSCHKSETFTLQIRDLRPDIKGKSLSPSELKLLSQHFMDSYFAVPKVLEGGEL